MTKPNPETTYVRSDCAAIAGMKRFSHEAMATTYEVIVVHEDERYARQAAAAAFEEVNRLEADLSRFIENSDISQINSLPVGRPLVLGLWRSSVWRLAAGFTTRQTALLILPSARS